MKSTKGTDPFIEAIHALARKHRAEENARRAGRLKLALRRLEEAREHARAYEQEAGTDD